MRSCALATGHPQSSTDIAFDVLEFVWLEGRPGSGTSGRDGPMSARGRHSWIAVVPRGVNYILEKQSEPDGLV
jgi:hypothetical protein